MGTIIEICTEGQTKFEVVSQITKAFLKRQTVYINDAVMADYSPYEGLRFDDHRDEEEVLYVASVDGVLTDVCQSAFDFYEYLMAEPLNRPSPKNAWTGRESDTTWKSSIPARW